MTFLSLRPFIPSGPDFNRARDFFTALGFRLVWEMPGYAGLEKDACAFILQQYDNEAFANNLMLTINIEDAAAFYQEVLDKELPARFGIRIQPPVQQAYGLEVNLIDIAGVCWHFVQA